MINLFHIIKSRYKINQEIALWYHPNYIPQIKSSSPHEKFLLKKAKKVLAMLKKNGLVWAKDLNMPKEIHWQNLMLFHTEEYIEKTTHEQFVSEVTGLKLDYDDAESYISAQRHVVQGTLNCAQSVISKKHKVAINLGGGLHHAEPNMGGGLCLYNDIGVAIKYLQKNSFEKKILIIDLDYHQGNGNVIGFKDSSNVFIYSINGDIWKDIKTTNAFEVTLFPGANTEQYMNTLRKDLPHVINEIRPELIFYIAGHDVLKDDFFGEFKMSVEGVFQRDRFVIDSILSKQIPLAITLGGGYGEDSWKGTYNFIKYLLTGNNINYSIKNEPSDIDEIYNKFEKALKIKQTPKKHRSTKKRQRDELTFSNDDIFGSSENLNNSIKLKKIFGVYSKSKLEFSLRKYGIFQKLKQLGHPNIKMSLEFLEQEQYMLRLHSTIDNNEYLICEMLFNLRMDKSPWRFFNIEWLLLQDPTKKFSSTGPISAISTATSNSSRPLPGQKFPGLSMSHDVLNLVAITCKRMNLDGIIFRPSHYHIALKSCQNFKYFDPEKEAKFLTIKKKLRSKNSNNKFYFPHANDDLDEKTLSENSYILENKKLVDKDNKVISFDCSDMILPISESCVQYFNSKEYLEIFQTKYSEYLSSEWHIVE